MKPLLSIITATYNAVDTIESTILSVINQDYPNIEYIIIDGGSTDGTVDIIKKYNNKIAYWVSEPDNGLYDAMNKGILQATGEWVTMRNCGDFFAEKKSLSKLFSEPVPNDVDFVCANAYRVGELGYYITKPRPIESVLKKMPIVHPATFVRTNWHKKNLFDIRFRVAADYNLVYNSYKKGCKFEYRDLAIVVFPEGGYSNIHWQVGVKDGYITRGQYCTFLQKIKFHVMITMKNIKSDILKVFKKVPFLKKKRDNMIVNMLGIKPLPIPLERFF